VLGQRLRKSSAPSGRSWAPASAFSMQMASRSCACPVRSAMSKASAGPERPRAGCGRPRRKLCEPGNEGATRRRPTGWRMQALSRLAASEITAMPTESLRGCPSGLCGPDAHVSRKAVVFLTSCRDCSSKLLQLDAMRLLPDGRNVARRRCPECGRVDTVCASLLALCAWQQRSEQQRGELVRLLLDLIDDVEAAWDLLSPVDPSLPGS
jgi:hypothetical protein